MSSVEGAASADAAHASGKWTWWKAITHSASQLHAGGAARRQGTYWHGCGAALGATSNQLLPERAPAPPPCEAGGKLALGAPAAWAGVLGSKRVAAWPVAHELASLYVHSLCNLRGCGCGCGCGCDRLRSVKCRPPGAGRLSKRQQHGVSTGQKRFRFPEHNGLLRRLRLGTLESSAQLLSCDSTLHRRGETIRPLKSSRKSRGDLCGLIDRIPLMVYKLPDSQNEFRRIQQKRS
jgi:hypothetical protein